MTRVLEPEVMKSTLEAETFDEYQKKTMRVWWPFIFGQIKKINVKRNSKILDVAAGPANFSIELSKTFRSKVVATDFSDEMLRIARKNVYAAEKKDRIRIVKDDAKKMKFRDNSFDFVFCRYLLHQIPEPLTVLNEIWRVTKPQGKIFVLDLLHPKTKKGVQRFLHHVEKDYKKHKIGKWKVLLKSATDSLAASLSGTEALALLKKSKFRNFKFKTDKRFGAFLITAIKS